LQDSARTLFADDPKRGERLTAEGASLYLDYSKNRISDATLALLLQLAEESGLRARIDAMFGGEKINVTEDRAVLHVALRAPRGTSIIVHGENVVPQVHDVLDKMSDFANRVRGGAWKGHTGKRIRNIINIGIGGSDLGPVMAYEALRYYSERTMTFRFVSNVDGTDFIENTRDLDPAETLFIVSSKTFTTQETMTNAQSAREWSLRCSALTCQPPDPPLVGQIVRAASRSFAWGQARLTSSDTRAPTTIAHVAITVAFLPKDERPASGVPTRSSEGRMQGI
jgi:glucose-6-phosphate isomerase